MFEKDIYQLIRGLRAHKGNERGYIETCLRECRREIKSQDMDQKATALLKLVYLEMFGHDMSWASFNVLEVMSSPKYLQKRVGYLAAVQSFRPDTEVLMLAENLLKKDLNSPDRITMSLPLVSIPHVINPSMANSLLTDLLPRLSHSNPAIRKKTIVTLYRLALVYPETLRPAWPKIKERLLDENEDPSVTAAVVNVVCELGWRRPADFLPLAPRLFELLTSGHNNWTAIKIIKLFSILTPLEPRLVRKLLPPLTNLIKTTPAMSLLYECINGIIQGGIMEAAGGTTEGDEIARLCVSKLRAMLVVEGDPNLRYVALLAFAKITSSHADIVSQHQDVILECIDDPDISIRTRALDLVVGMVNANNLPTVVERLLKQLQSAGRADEAEDPVNDRTEHGEVIPMAFDDEDDEDAQTTISPKAQRSKQAPPLPDDYRASVIERILEMCSANTYANMVDFEWYIGVLVGLVKQCPATSATGSFASNSTALAKESLSTADAVGAELLNVAVRVKAIRPEAAAAAQSLLLVEEGVKADAATSSGSQGVLGAAAFIAGEYATLLPNPEAVLTSLLHASTSQLPAPILADYVQAVPSVFAALTGNSQVSWTSTRRNTTNLFIARIIHFLEPLTLHPDLEVQERAVEYLDLMRLASEAVANQDVESDDSGYSEPPLLLTQAIPALFSGSELNPVAPTALRKVPLPTDLDLTTPINPNLQFLLSQADHGLDFSSLNPSHDSIEPHDDTIRKFYHDRPAPTSLDSRSAPRPAAETLLAGSGPGSALASHSDPTSRSSSYQNGDDSADPTTGSTQLTAEQRRRRNRERRGDDPYYIGGADDDEDASGRSTPLHGLLRGANGGALDVDAIPVMELKLDVEASSATAGAPIKAKKKTAVPRRRFEVAADETLGGDDAASSGSGAGGDGGVRPAARKALMGVDSSGLAALRLGDAGAAAAGSKVAARLDAERRIAEEEEMARAMKEVERLRLEMQRAEERVEVKGGNGGEQGVIVKRKKKAKQARLEGDDLEEGNAEGEVAVVKKKKKKKKREEDAGEVVEGEKGEVEESTPQPVKVKKKKKREVVFEE